MAELDRKGEVAGQQFEKLKNSSQEAWRDMKPGIDAAMRDLEPAYKRTAADLNKLPVSQEFPQDFAPICGNW